MVSTSGSGQMLPLPMNEALQENLKTACNVDVKVEAVEWQVLLNAGRGGLQNEADILSSIADGTLGAASLDVFEQEPLPADSPFWDHPAVVLTPHNAADTDPDEISKYVAQQIAQFEAGGALENVVDRGLGY